MPFSKPLKIASFNLFNYLAPPLAYYEFNNIYSEQQWLRKQAWIKQYLATYQPDVIALQEVFSSASLAALLKDCGYAYFAVVDTMTVEQDFICSKPVVALASKYPINEVSAVDADLSVAQQLGLSADFSFSRAVLRATVELPLVGASDCYVVHFKSKRPMLEYLAAKPLDNKQSLQRLMTEIAGSWASSIQRGSEATLLLLAMIKRRAETGLPMLLCGDFNNELNDGILQQLLSDDLRFAQDSPGFNAKRYLLKDAWQLYLESNDKQQQRTATHYYGAGSSVLDYILLSSEFDAYNSDSTYTVVDYHTYDKHLINPHFEVDDLSTDHAIPMVTLLPRK